MPTNPKDEKLRIALKNYNEWMSSAVVPDELKTGLDILPQNDDLLINDFYSVLDFGTAGLRGKMKPGLGAMNIFTVALATKALGEVIKAEKGEKAGVAIACDSRNHSEEFSKVAAEVLAYEGIHTYIFDSIRPTPELSFAIREYGCKAGINITASHNPKEDNGYKAYWEDGAQLPPEKAKTVSSRMKALDIFRDVYRMPFNEAREKGLITILSEEADEKYLSEVLACRLNTEAVEAVSDNYKIIYTPLHGTGYKLVPEILKRSGFKHILTVSEQMIPDGNFPTVEKPNPQFKEVFDLGIKIAEEQSCDLIIATDPDADRCGVCVRNQDGEFVTVTGNQMGVLLLDYIIKSRKEKGIMPENPCAVKSLVSSELAAAVCKKNGVEIMDVYTGFKYIGEKIEEFERTGKHSFIFGFEESYGYLAGNYARDKDAVFAAMLIAEMGAYYSLKGKTLYDALTDLYDEYGYSAEYLEDVLIKSLDFKGRAAEITNSLREKTPESFGEDKVTVLDDFLNRRSVDLLTGKETELPLHSENMLRFTLRSGSKIILRPSGTEPKMKLYYFISSKNKEEADRAFASLKAAASFIKDMAQK